LEVEGKVEKLHGKVQEKLGQVEKIWANRKRKAGIFQVLTFKQTKRRLYD
jgi:flagellar biosynthesis chaperone FliJ